MTNKEKQLVTIYADQAFHGGTIRQVYPTCECGKVFNEKELYNAPGSFSGQSISSAKLTR